ncbi:unnamed protein product [marine sediment metagenome]|uniref:Uncharacterized protein n=1 Tax=marine sediment metagenome TaxID=412755 RepID=X1JKK5_9ZZZZ
MVESINISIGGVVVKRLSDYIHREDKSETYQRTINRKLIINRSVNVEDQPITRYHFEIPGVEDDELFNIRVAALKKSNLHLIDYYEIPEVLSGDGMTETFWLQRQISTTTGMVVKVNGVEVSPTITLNDNGRGKLVFTVAPTDADDNIVVRYVPKYLVHATLWDRTYIYNGLLTYILICEEV